jgi:type VI secretion system ImpC/EvpB family protein
MTQATGGADPGTTRASILYREKIPETSGARAPSGEEDRLRDFLAEPSPLKALALWVGEERLRALRDKTALRNLLSRDIARIDALLSEQVNAILHHPQFQGLEASWRGLRYLVEGADPEEGIKVRVLSVSWKELARDAERAAEFDQSQLWRKIYNEEFGMPGGEPFGVLIGDYELRHRPAADHPIDDLDVLESISHVAAAAFAPFLAAASPALLGLESFNQLERPMELGKIFQHEEYLRWRSFRDSEDSRFVGLTLPRVLMRLPYRADGSRADGFRFHEDVEGPDSRKYLWGNAAYAFGAVLLRAFTESRWLAEIRGVKRDELGGGLVTGLPVHSFGMEAAGVAGKCSTELTITDQQEKELGDLGFVPLCHLKDTEHCAFYGNASVQKPKTYTEIAATMNARISSMLQYMLCVSRFAHYLKVRTQYKIGGFTEAQMLEDDLNRWINDYVAPDAEASPAVKAKFPLREAQVQVKEAPGRPGSYQCVMHLMPHYQLDTVTASVSLKTEMGPGR